MNKATDIREIARQITVALGFLMTGVICNNIITFCCFVSPPAIIVDIVLVLFGAMLILGFEF